VTALSSLDVLREEIRRIEGGFGQVRQRRHIPTGIAALDQHLPAGGLAAGALHELIAAREGVGVRTFALWMARQAAMDGRYILWIDPACDFYPPAAWAWGIPPQRLVLVRPRTRQDAFWAMDQSLRSRGVAAVVGSPGAMSRSEARRLQLAAETGGGIGLLIQVERHTGTRHPPRRVNSGQASRRTLDLSMRQGRGDEGGRAALNAQHSAFSSKEAPKGRQSIAGGISPRTSPFLVESPGGAKADTRNTLSLIRGLPRCDVDASASALTSPAARDPQSHRAAGDSGNPQYSLMPLGLASCWHIRNPQYDGFAHEVTGRAQRFVVEILRCRGGGPVPPVLMEVDHDAGLVALSAGLADRSAAAVGGAAQSRAVGV